MPAHLPQGFVAQVSFGGSGDESSEGTGKGVGAFFFLSFFFSSMSAARLVNAEAGSP